MRAPLLIVASLALLPHAASAQATWLSDEAPAVTIELLRPWLALPRFAENGERIDDAYPKAASAGIFAGVRYPLEHVDIVAELPVATGGLNDGESATLLGNVYLGAEYGARRAWGIRAGVRLPTSPDLDSASFGTRVIGTLASPGDRLHAFDPKATSVIASVQHVNRPSRFVELRFSAGGERVDYEDYGTAFALLLALQAMLDYERTRIGGGLYASFQLEGDYDRLDEGQQFEVFVDRAFGRVRPGIIVRRVMGAEVVDRWENPLVFGVKAEIAF